MTRPREHRRDDRGATALLTAVLAVVLFGVAALAVEITDMYSRDRASQTTADLAALSGAQGLPDACAAFDRARRTLNDPDNAVRDDGTPGPYAATADQLRDGDGANGEIWVLQDYERDRSPRYLRADVVSVADCDGSATETDVTTGPGRFIKVVTPSSRVDFVFGSAISGRTRSGRVKGTAVAGLTSPALGETLPLYLPVTCTFGPTYLLTDHMWDDLPSADPLDGVVDPGELPPAAAPGCGNRATGDLGLMQSDGDDVLAAQMNDGTGVNLTVMPSLPTVDTPCGGGEPPTAVRSTRDPATDGANCVSSSSRATLTTPGDALTRGLLGSTGGHGRLSGAAGSTAPPSCEPRGPGDMTPGDLRWRVPGTGADVVNTQLSCYLPEGDSLGDLQDCQGCLAAGVVEDPRFFLVPVLHVSGRMATEDQWPVAALLGAFITDEVQSSPGTCDSSVRCNGLELDDADGRLLAAQVFVFPLRALPHDVPIRGDGAPYSGDGLKDFLLIE